METGFNAMAHFSDMVRENQSALKFYAQCGPIQRKVIYRQLSQVDSPEQLRGFVDNLPSAAL